MNEHVDLSSTEATNTVACNCLPLVESTEEWRPVIGYDGLYEISNCGRVKSLRGNYGTQRELIMKPQLNSRGYFHVCLTRHVEGKREQKTWRIHILVANAFLPVVKGADVIDHINGCKTDNRAVNLRRCTQKENINNPNTKPKAIDAAKINAAKRMVTDNGYRIIKKAARCSAAVTSKPVVCLLTGLVYPSARAASEITKRSLHAISFSCKAIERNAKQNRSNGRRQIIRFAYYKDKLPEIE